VRPFIRVTVCWARAHAGKRV